MSSDYIRHDESWGVIITIIVISIVSSVFLPFFMVLLLQNAFYHSMDYYLFAAPNSAYFTFMAGILWIPLILTLYLVFQKISKQKVPLWLQRTIVGLLLSLSILICYFGVNNYYYFDEQGLHYRHLFSQQESLYQWNEIQEVNQINQVKDGAMTPQKVIFSLKDHKEIVIKYNQTYNVKRGYILAELRDRNIPFNLVNVGEEQKG